VLEVVARVLPHLVGAAAAGAGGAAMDEERKNASFSINSQQHDQNRGDENNERVPLMEGLSATAHIAGTIDVKEKNRLNRLLYRATKGNAIVYFEDIAIVQKDLTGKPMEKSSYIITFTEGRAIRNKITNICDSFSGHRTDLPDLSDIARRITEVNRQI
jgi:vacuolar-type H+-ATPase subunit I/STV1